MSGKHITRISLRSAQNGGLRVLGLICHVTRTDDSISRGTRWLALPRPPSGNR